jgi:D-sedoheptulose 7-phosphate isomerase
MNHESAEEYIQALHQAQAAFYTPAMFNRIRQQAVQLAEAFRSGNRVWACGNGGSMSDAIHFAEELSGRFRGNRTPLPALAISDPGYLTCVANDYGYEHVFSRFLEAHARSGDWLVVFTTSGKSPNILHAARQAQSQQVSVLAITGDAPSPIHALADHLLLIPYTGTADHVQEITIQLVHLLILEIEKLLFVGTATHA